MVSPSIEPVTPAKAGVHNHSAEWTPAFAGVTDGREGAR